jgi:hypothetical protein
MKNSVILFLFLFFAFSLSAQDSFNAAGGEATGPEITLTYSVGQVFVEPVAYTEGSLTPGVQQAWITGLGTGRTEVAADLHISVFPNPATDYFFLSFPGYRKEAHTLRLFDAAGKSLYFDEIKEETSQIDVQSLATGTYFLQIANSEQIIELFKIIKK